MGTRSFFQLSAGELADIARASEYRQRELATRLNLTPRTLERHFQLRFGCTPSDWIAALRMSDAIKFLASGGSIKQVAIAVAFHHRTSFHREFRRCFRCTPQEYMETRNTTMEMGSFHQGERLSQSATLLSQSATPRPLPVAVAM